MHLLLALRRARLHMSVGGGGGGRSNAYDGKRGEINLKSVFWRSGPLFVFPFFSFVVFWTFTLPEKHTTKLQSSCSNFSLPPSSHSSLEAELVGGGEWTYGILFL